MILLITLAAQRAEAQLSPHASWRTVSTAHFRVHFTPELETLARRAAASAEQAYGELAAELRPPRGTIDIVLSDDADFSNGWATPFPTNRIVVFAHPPADGQSLRFYHDWLALVITHELTHIFHLDRTRGLWRAAQWVFGRNPFLFPNTYQPRWVTEGIAVYYESRLTGYGRLAGTEHAALATAHVIAGVTPRLDELSLATPRFPGGQAAYAFGSLLFEHLAETRGPQTVPEFIERSSAATIPFLLDRTARRSFGVSFTTAWREWRDSLVRSVSIPGEPIPGWRELTREGRYALHPRWVDDTTLVYAGSTGRETPGAYRLSTRGAQRRLGRRNGIEPNVPMPDGSLLFSQPDFRSPYTIRSDLYLQRGRTTRRLTHGARVAFPDARGDGAIVAVRAGLGTTHLVRVSDDGHVTALTAAHPDTQWSEPRWSPDGRELAAVRWLRGGISEIVVTDTLGAVRRILARDRAVNGSPSWSADGAAIVYNSDRGGVTDVYMVPATSDVDAAGLVPSIAPGTTRLSDSPTGVMHPELSRRGDALAAVHFRADGYHVGVGSPSAERPVLAGPEDRRSLAPAEVHAGPVRRYSPWRSLVPRYWLPTLVDVTDERVLIGAMTGAGDLVNRHAYAIHGMGATNGEQYAAEGYWRYSGLGQPVLDVGVVRRSDPPFLVRVGTVVGAVRETENRLTFGVGVSRPRYRTFAFAQAGVDVERFEYASDTAPVRDALPKYVDRRGLFVASGWSNARRPALSISPEDGVSISTYALRRWSTGANGRWSTTLVAAAKAYKSLDLPGFAHHVIALRGAAGYTDQETFSRFTVGGVSGSSVSLVPGVSLGDSRRTFGVRGFPVQEVRGIRAAGGTAEYRVPFLLPARGYRLLPLFFDRTSIVVFTEAAATWCPAAPRTGLACPVDGLPRRWLASAGAELNLDAAVLSYDFPYRFRFGVAAPYYGRELAESAATAYFTVGLAF